MGYFRELISKNEEVQRKHSAVAAAEPGDNRTVARKPNTALVSSLERDPLLAERLKRLENRSRSGADHRAHLGVGDRRCSALPVGEASHQLLRAGGVPRGSTLLPHRLP